MQGLVRYSKGGQFTSGSDLRPSKWQARGAQVRPMFNIDLLRSQRGDLLAMADRLLPLVDHYDRRTAAIPIVMQLNRLLGLLRVHLAHEDIQLYPTLIASSDAEVVRTGQRHVDEMRGLASDFESFARRW